MYGSEYTLLMNPPHIFISSNFYPDLSILSDYRWKVFEIQKTKKLE